MGNIKRNWDGCHYKYEDYDNDSLSENIVEKILGDD